MLLVIAHHPLMIVQDVVPIGIGELLDPFINTLEVAIPKVSTFSRVTMLLRGFDLHHVPHHLRHVCQLGLEGCLGLDVRTVWQAVQLCDDFPRDQPFCVWEDC